MSGEEKLHDRKGIFPEDQQALHERDQMAERGPDRGSRALHHQGSNDPVDDPAERGQEVPASEEGKATRSKRPKTEKKKPRRVGQVIPKGANKWTIRIFRGKDNS